MSIWAKIFNQQSQQQESIKAFREIGGSKCAGAWDSITGEFDPFQDRAYHEANPTAPACDDGITGGSTAEETWKVFIGHTLTDQQREDMGFGVFESNDLAIYVPILYSFSETSAGVSGNVRLMEFPIGSGRIYRVENPNVWELQGTPLYRFAKLVVEDEGDGTGLPSGLDT